MKLILEATGHINDCGVVALGTGPGKAWSARDQGQYLFELAGRKPNFIQVPVALMDVIIGILDFFARLIPGLEVSLVANSMLSCCWSGMRLTTMHDKIYI